VWTILEHVGNAKEDGNVVSILEALIKSRRKKHRNA